MADAAAAHARDAATSPAMRVAIGQIRMCWTVEDNLVGMHWAIALAARHGARLCVLPELAVTGFHRQIAQQARPERVAPALALLARLCAEHGIAVAAGAPTFMADGRIGNAHVYIDARGQVLGAVEKSGLTPAEATFFAAGTGRPIIAVDALACTSVICREIEDVAQVTAQLLAQPRARRPQVVLWPGAMRPAIDGSDPDPERHVKQAQSLACHLRAMVVQANWPNALNRPEESAQMGRSVVIDAAGEELLRLPMAEAGLGVFDLGARRADWWPQPA